MKEFPKPKRRHGSPEFRFFRYVTFSDGCCEWRGCRDKRGYGRTSRSPLVLAHRFSWFIFNGEIPKGLHVLHKCDNTSCVKPTHLFLGTHLDNMRDKKKKGREVIPRFRGEAHSMAKLTKEDVLLIRELHSSGAMNQRELSRKFNICNQHISRIVNKQRWEIV